MTIDIESLKSYKKRVTDNLSKNFGISCEAADDLLRLLETEDLLIIEAPKYQDKPATVLIPDKHILKDELSMTSHKVGNVILNTYLDWKNLASAITGAVLTSAGIDLTQPFLTTVGIISLLLAALEISAVGIAENGTAIVMALQNFKRHRLYMADEETCRGEANKILVSCGYAEMDEKKFQDEVTKLIGFHCVDEQDGVIRLKEKVITQYYR